MRMRRKKNLEARLEACGDYILYLDRDEKNFQDKSNKQLTDFSGIKQSRYSASPLANLRFGMPSSIAICAASTITLLLFSTARKFLSGFLFAISLAN